jgi:hypothetical protein
MPEAVGVAGRLCGALLLAVSLTHCVHLEGAGARPLDLAALGRWNIVVSSNAIPAESYAAEELQQWLGAALGKAPAIATHAAGRGRHIFVGAGADMRRSSVGFDPADLGPEDLRIVIQADNIAIAGGGPRGTLYGVYTFLEDYFGVRFLTPDHTHVPRLAGSRRIGPLDRVYRPPFRLRYSYCGENHKDHVFAVRLRNNAIDPDPRFGGVPPDRVISHSFNNQVPIERYRKDHPEYYAEIDGIRRVNVTADWHSEGTQLCLTNPDVLRLVSRSVMDELSGHPAWRNIAVSQNDNLHYCRCPACRAVNAAEESPMGTQLAFVNAVADAVAARYPGVRVGTLSYQYTRKPPKNLRPRPNVEIQLCSFEACVVHALNDPACPENASFLRDLRGWTSVCTNVSVWNYNGNFRDWLLPFPNFQAIEPNLRLFRDCRVRGLFMHGMDYAGAFSELRNYMISSLMWDPDRDGQQLMEEFLSLHYGRAAEPIRRFIRFSLDQVAARGLHPCSYGNRTGMVQRIVSLNCDQARSYGFTPDFSTAADFAVDEATAREGLKAFAEAMDLAESDTIRARVEKASLTALRAAIEPLWNRGDPSQVDPTVLRELRPLASRFFRLGQKHGLIMVEEHGSLDKYRDRVKSLYRLGKDEEL